MKKIPVSSLAMSAFFSLPLSGSFYDAGNDHVRAAAGNSAQVERTLADFVDRMGGAATAPMAITEAKPVSVILVAQAQAKDIRPAIKWVEEQGRPARLEAPVAQALGIALVSGQDVPTIQKAYRIKSKNIVYLLNVARVNGRREVILSRRIDSITDGWRVTESGEILTTVHIDNTVELKIDIVPNERYQDLFQECADFFLSKVPAPSGG